MAEKRVQRRLAAILAADVVGYSRLMGKDEEGTHARLNSLRRELLHPKVSEYGGRIVKTTGDGTLIEFPTREGLNEGFRFHNPNVKQTCGCGESFSI